MPTIISWHLYLLSSLNFYKLAITWATVSCVFTGKSDNQINACLQQVVVTPGTTAIGSLSLITCSRCSTSAFFSLFQCVPSIWTTGQLSTNFISFWSLYLKVQHLPWQFFSILFSLFSLSRSTEQVVCLVSLSGLQDICAGCAIKHSLGQSVAREANQIDLLITDLRVFSLPPWRTHHFPPIHLTTWLLPTHILHILNT